MNKKERKIIDGMLDRIEAADSDMRGIAIVEYGDFVRAVSNRIHTEIDLKQHNLTEK